MQDARWPIVASQKKQVPEIQGVVYYIEFLRFFVNSIRLSFLGENTT